MQAQTVNGGDRSVTDVSPTPAGSAAEQARHMLDMLGRNAVVPVIRTMLFPKCTVREARERIVRAAERPEFAQAIVAAWGSDVGRIGVLAWERWCMQRRSARERMRSLRRLIQLCQAISAFIDGDMM